MLGMVSRAKEWPYQADFSRNGLVMGGKRWVQAQQASPYHPRFKPLWGGGFVRPPSRIVGRIPDSNFSGEADSAGQIRLIQDLEAFAG